MSNVALKNMNDQNYYDILEVKPGASDHEIHAAYLRAKKTYSPDSPALYTMFSAAEAKELLGLVEEAYKTLSNRAQREKYDAQFHSNSPRGSMTSRLPDFELFDDYKQGSKKSGKTKPNVALHFNSSVPKGFRKTKFGVYPVNEDFEQEIELCTHFDGPMLRRVREYKAIDLEQLAIETKISKTYLSAIESQSFSQLPAPVFVRGFVVQLARALGLNEALAAQSFMQQYRADKA